MLTGRQGDRSLIAEAFDRWVNLTIDLLAAGSQLVLNVIKMAALPIERWCATFRKVYTRGDWPVNIRTMRAFHRIEATPVPLFAISVESQNIPGV